MKGQLTMVSNGNSVTRYKTFDPMGRITSSTQPTSAADFDFSYTYDLAGGLASVSYPVGQDGELLRRHCGENDKGDTG